ncbi:restriction endonuclease subunit S [Limnobacter profundi]|uniref:Restriction endonuclease subunit S n=1 Tax=Limnobacter profundi TaxID=2732163 RepID=A0ABX6N471_9BURK|nr:restriction endonuclease subunit S [Limnobacter sp. SAORIC-580]QJR29179.1 restriction endonuclease subunit S [Limnobacter sp. SAORIC-580]
MARSLTKDGIPTGWKYDLLDKFATRCSGHTPSKSFPEYWNGGIKWISLADSFRLDQGYVYETDKKISQVGIANSSAELHPAETVVLSRDAGIGKCGVMAEPMAVSQHFIAWKCDNSEKLNSWFLYNWLQLNKVEFERQAVGSTIKTIGLPYFKKLKIAVPPYPEQKKIAQILSTWDKAIEVTEQLLVKSQQQKKALMQQLLTGKKRLLDKNGVKFSEKWEWLRASELFKTVSRKNNSKTEELLAVTQDQGVLPRSMLERRVVMPDGSTQGYKLVVPGNFIISLRSFQGGLEYSNYRGLVSPAYTVLEPLKSICDEFFKQYYKSYDFIGHLAVAVIGIRDGKQVSYEDFSFLRLPYPSLAEQEKIAKIISVNIQEIECLQKKLETLKQEKKALMKQLLTGRRRVEIEEASECQ